MMWLGHFVAHDKCLSVTPIQDHNPLFSRPEIITGFFPAHDHLTIHDEGLVLERRQQCD